MKPSLINIFEGFIMKHLMIAVLAVWATSVGASESNAVMKQCIDSTSDWNAAAACHSKYRQAVQKQERAELKDFLKHNPRYRVPGQSMNRCWGKPREMPFEKSTISVGPEGMSASVWYKDKLPAGCYENAPWDNRDNKQ